MAHSGLALSQLVVLQPFAHSVQVVSTACGLSHGRERKRYCLVVIAPTGQTSIRLPERIECTPCSLKVAISLPLPRLMVPICASPSTSAMKRLQRVHRMQRLRFSISVGPKSTSALTPSPSKVRRGKSIRLSSLPNAYEKSCSGHSPPLSHTGQSSGWLIRRNSNTPLRPSTAS